MSQYTLVITQEPDGRHSVSVPALPGCHTWGDTVAHAVEMAHEAIDLYLEDMRSNAEPISTDDRVVVMQVDVA